ncbi:Golgi resident protein GCP60-like [Rhopilema esculentum]|uniref:Golgi resident protein GCP60-like n=1 Tax=Rhopilema esculentum TaxID=499914 RepID=UPI0031D1CFEA|eukprot:gene3005-1266_t
MEEVRPDLTGHNCQSVDQNLTIPSEVNEKVIVNGWSSGKVYKYGFTLEELFNLSLDYYKKGKKVLNLNYEDKLLLVAYYKQISCGNYDSSKMPETGYFDVVGSDRRKAWQALANVPVEDAMIKFCQILEKGSALYEPYMEAQKRDKEEKERKLKEEMERKKREEEERKRKEEEERKRAEEEENQRKLEEELARKKLAEEAEALRRKAEVENHQRKEEESKHQEKTPGGEKPIMVASSPVQGVSEHKIAQASLWTRPKLNEFIQHVKRDASSIIVVGRGETVTVRVPTHEHGSCLFWEFASESYDIGFGIYFEWSTSDSKDDKVKLEENEGEMDEGDDTDENKPEIDEVLPVLRRNSHEEVIVGSHLYPGQGVYLLKFDNSYSLLRSKTLYYRVYYTR